MLLWPITRCVNIELVMRSSSAGFDVAEAGIGHDGAGASAVESLPVIDLQSQELRDLVAANAILYDRGVVDGFGHVSARLTGNPRYFLMARSMAPALVRAEDVVLLNLAGEPCGDFAGALYLERFIHSEIYRARADVMAVVHSHSPSIIPFGCVTETALRPVYHMAGFLAPHVPRFEIRDVAGAASNMLVSDALLGQALSRTLGSATVVLMRGHGSTAVGNSLRQAVFNAVYTEINARLQSEAMRLGRVTYLNDDEATQASTTNARQVDRAWDLWRMQAERNGLG
jgi:HCOMODA/2-hydroxy-3-carboxy-muconic semialdehyde decarboxylase